MKPVFAVLLCLGSISLAAQEEIPGTWYRNEINATATLSVGKDLRFSIEAYHTAHSGVLKGTIERIDDGLYFARINDTISLENCLLIFSINNGTLNIRVYGSQTGAGATVYYDGDYTRKKMSKEQYTSEALDMVLDNTIDKQIVIALLGSDLNYFTECFAFKEKVQPADSYLLQCYKGVMPGAALAQNGIYAVRDKYFYTLFLDCRQKAYRFQYYTNDQDRKDIPATFVEWIRDRTNYSIVKHMRK